MKIHEPFGIYEKYFKRPLDFCCGLFAIIIFWWLYLIVAILVRIKLGKPVIYKQNRPGKNERIFKLYKFRTMTNEKNEKGELLPDEMRLTSFGSFLRKTSLDELPEAINIIKGDMSVVGPRPLRVKYLTRYNSFQHRRHEVLPGLTGLAQVNGRNGITWNKKFEYDIKYVDNITFWGDIKLILKTVSNVIKSSGDGSGIDVDEEFLGNDI